MANFKIWILRLSSFRTRTTGQGLTVPDATLRTVKYESCGPPWNGPMCHKLQQTLTKPKLLQLVQAMSRMSRRQGASLGYGISRLLGPGMEMESAGGMAGAPSASKTSWAWRSLLRLFVDDVWAFSWFRAIQGNLEVQCYCRTRLA